MNTITKWNKDVLLGMFSLAPLHAFISRFEGDSFPALKDCNALLLSCNPAVVVRSGKPLKFVPQEEDGRLPFEAQYEPRCYLQGEVPMRADNWHDLFNALVWMAFPKAKAAINARHYRALSGGNNTERRSQRGAVRDTITLLDESGVIVVCSKPELAELLRGFKWNELFWQRRSDVQSCMGFYLFGHGLYEKALRPYVGMTGQGLLLSVEQAFFSWTTEQQLRRLDGLLSDYLSSHQHCISTRELTPIPVLGVPGWTMENENAAYYSNTDYFRSCRYERATK